MKIALAIIFATTLARAADVPITQDELVRRTQELCDAIAPGNQAPWKKYFADDCIFSDEKGRTMDKAKLVADITPMPAGYSGAIKIANVQSRIIGDTAVLSYDLNETETILAISQSLGRLIMRSMQSTRRRPRTHVLLHR